jgi:hypothetical protein
MSSICQIEPCGQPADTRVTWLTPGLGWQSAILCPECIQKLWDGNLRAMCAINEAAIWLEPIGDS